MPVPICRLCRAEVELEESHIIPAFVFRWHKDSSATGFLRRSDQPNRRVQDGERRKWLCRNCEARLSTWESHFARSIFFPLLQQAGQRVQYGNWMLKFCASLSWRSLHVAIDDNPQNLLTERNGNAVREALESWRRFLLGEIPHPGVYEQHFLPIERIKIFGGLDFPQNINRYLFRSIDIDLPHNDNEAIVCTKLGKFIVIGLLNVRDPSKWKGSKVRVRGGSTGHGRYLVPASFGEYIFEKSKKYAEAGEAISQTQKEKIKETLRRNWPAAKNSDTFRAIDNDIWLQSQSTSNSSYGR